MNGPAAARCASFDETALGSLLADAAGSDPIRLIGVRLHDLAAQLVADGMPVEAVVPSRRDARALRRALRHAGRRDAVTPLVASIGIDLPFPDSALGVLVCRLDPRTFPFPRHTVRELGRVVAPGGTVVLLAGGQVPWPSGLVDAWAASAGLMARGERDAGGESMFAGAVYESRALA